MAREIILFFIIFSVGVVLLTFGAIVWITRIWENIALRMREKISSGMSGSVGTLGSFARRRTLPLIRGAVPHH